MPTLTVPDLAPVNEFTIPEYATRILGNGMKVLAVSRPSVPLVEVRMRVPLAHADVATSSVLTQTILAGTSDKSMRDITIALQMVGATVSAGVDPDRFLLAGHGLKDGLPVILATMAEILTDATYPADQVEVERDRLSDRIRVARQQPSHIVQQTLLRRMYGDHPYGIQTPDPAEVSVVESSALRLLHSERMYPTGSTLVIVGDFPVEKALDEAEAAFLRWVGDVSPRAITPVPELVPGTIILKDRPESVQSSLRVATTAVPRTHADNAAQHLANFVYGGYFSSRLVHNIREEKGYTYSPRSAVDHAMAGSAIIISADVATDVTAAALCEVWYEMGRLATTKPTSEELEQARRYALGSLRLGTATQTGLASLMSMLIGTGLTPDWLLEHADRLAKVSVDDIERVAAGVFAPSKAVTVVLGDKTVIENSLARLSGVEVQ